MKKRHISLANRIYRKKTIEKIEKKITLLGLRNSNKAETFLNIRLFSSLIVLILGFFLFSDLLLSIIIMIAYYYLLPYICLDLKIIKRSKKLEQDAMLFFEVLALAVQSGKDLVTYLRLTTDTVDSSLSGEFKIVLYEVKYGKSLTASLNDMKKRIPSSTLNNVILNMIECYTTGGNFSLSLMEQVQYIRTGKVMEIKEKINKLPIQISVVSVVFMVPMILLLILAPAIIEYFVA